MANGDTRHRSARLGLALVQPSAGEPLPHAPRPPGHLSLRRAAEMVEGAAYDLAGTESPVFVSRLIEIAAELERHARAPQASPEVRQIGARSFRLD